MSVADTVVWHDLEHSGYRADIPVWLGIVGSDGPAAVVELGAGAGRVSLPLAAAGHSVMAVDTDPRLLAALRAGKAPGMDLATVCADATETCGRIGSDWVLAPALLVQMVGGASGRARLLSSVARSLKPGGGFAAAIDPGLPSGSGEVAVAGTERTRSTPGRRWTTRVEALATSADTVTLIRARRSGGLQSRCRDEVLWRLSPALLAVEARRYGLELEATIPIPRTGIHSGVTVAVFRGR